MAREFVIKITKEVLLTQAAKIIIMVVEANSKIIGGRNLFTVEMCPTESDASYQTIQVSANLNLMENDWQKKETLNVINELALLS